MQGTIILALVFAILVAIFSIQNAVPVSLSFIIWEFEISLVVVVLGAMALTAIVIALFNSFKQFKLKRQLRSLKKEKEELSAEKERLKEKLGEIEEDQSSQTNKSQDINKIDYSE